MKFRKFHSVIAVLASLALATGLSMPAQAATNAISAGESSNTYTIDSPSSEDLLRAKEAIEAEKLKDPQNFNQRVSIVRSSPATMDYIKSYSGVNVDLQVQALAVSMPLEPLTGFTEMLDAGVISFDTVANNDGSFTVTIQAESKNDSAGEVNGLPVSTPATWPACPSAWAAFWAWMATDAAMCSAVSMIPAAAVSCVVGFGLGGLIIDFNAGC